jgi:hypothetical protein
VRLWVFRALGRCPFVRAAFRSACAAAAAAAAAFVAQAHPGAWRCCVSNVAARALQGRDSPATEDCCSSKASCVAWQLCGAAHGTPTPTHLTGQHAQDAICVGSSLCLCVRVFLPPVLCLSGAQGSACGSQRWLPALIPVCPLHVPACARLGCASTHTPRGVCAGVSSTPHSLTLAAWLLRPS